MVLFYALKRGTRIPIFCRWQALTLGVVSARGHGSILSHSQQKFALASSDPLQE